MVCFKGVDSVGVHYKRGWLQEQLELKFLQYLENLKSTSTDV